MSSAAQMIARVIALALCCSGALAGSFQVAEGADEPSVELTLRYDEQGKRLTLRKQRLVAVAAPKRRRPEPQREELILQCQDSTGQILGQMPVVDPTVIHADWPMDPEGPEPGLLTGTQVRLPEADLVIVVPFDEHLAQVKLLKPKFRRDGKLDRLDGVGSCPVNRAQLREYLEQRKADHRSSGRP